MDDRDIPVSLSFVLLNKQGANLLTSTATPVQVSFRNSSGQLVYLGSECAGGGCTMVRESHSNTGTPKYKFHYQSLDMSFVSLNGGRTYYINLGGKTDTLYYDRQKSGNATLSFNGRPAAIDPDQLPVYVLQRQH